MGRLEDELERIRQELEALDSSRSSEGLERRMARIKEITAALRSGGDVSGYDPREVAVVEGAMARYLEVAKKVAERMAKKEGTIDGDDGGWRSDEDR